MWHVSQNITPFSSSYSSHGHFVFLCGKNICFCWVSYFLFLVWISSAAAGPSNIISFPVWSSRLREAKSPKNEIWRPIRNASKILRLGQTFLETHEFQGTMLYPALQVTCSAWSTLLFVCVHKLNNNKEDTYLNCGKFPSSRWKNVNDGFINSWSLDSSKMLVISYQSWKFLIETNKNLPSKKEMRGSEGHCKYSGLPSSLPMYVKVYMS